MLSAIPSLLSWESHASLCAISSKLAGPSQPYGFRFALTAVSFSMPCIGLKPYITKGSTSFRQFIEPTALALSQYLFVCRIVFIAVIVISLISLKGFHMIWHN
jgi:hypothetical protein